MRNETLQKNDSLKALAIGFVLIVAVVGIIFFKSQAKSGTGKTDISDDAKLAEVEKVKLASMSVEVLNKKLLENDDIMIIDVRSQEEYRQEHIIDSKNIPLDQLRTSLSQLSLDKQFVLVDGSGDPAAISAAEQELTAMNYSDTPYLSGGFAAWKASFGRTISDGDPLSFTDQAKVNYIDCDGLKKAIDSGEEMVIIDVRKSGQYGEGHIKNALNIYLEDIERRRKEIPYGTKIVVYDNDGLWAFKAAARLFDLGILDVSAVSDGLDTWKKKKYELVR